MNFSEFMEEWKPFPKDKVNRQIEKKEKSGDADEGLKAHTMKAVKNFRTKMTDPSKAQQFNVGTDRKKTNAVRDKHNRERDKAVDKMDKIYNKAIDSEGEQKVGDKKYKKLEKKFDKNINKSQKAAKRRDGIDAVQMSSDRNTWTDDKKQAEVNKKSNEDRRKARVGKKKADLEAAYKRPAVKGATKGGFKESMNFTEFTAATTSPLYQVEGDIPKCPPGYKFDPKQMRCVPKTEKDKVGDGQQSKDLKPGNGGGYNTWGRTGMNGDGYAWEEPPTTNDLTVSEAAKSTGKKMPESVAKKARQEKSGKRKSNTTHSKATPTSYKKKGTATNKPAKPKKSLTDRVKALESTKRRKQEADRKKRAATKKKAAAKPPRTMTHWDD